MAAPSDLGPRRSRPSYERAKASSVHALMTASSRTLHPPRQLIKLAVVPAVRLSDVRGFGVAVDTCRCHPLPMVRAPHSPGRQGDKTHEKRPGILPATGMTNGSRASARG